MCWDNLSFGTRSKLSCHDLKRPIRAPQTPSRRTIRDRLERMIRKALLLFAAFAFIASAHAQFSVYGTVTLDHLSGIQSSPVLNVLSPPPCTSSVTTSCTAYKNSVDPIGFTGGVTYAIKNVGPVLLSADVRGVIESYHQGAQANAQGAGTRIYSVLGGVKASFHTPLRFVLPYVQGSVGYARSNYGVLTNATAPSLSDPTYPGIATQGNIQYSGYGGIDLRIAPVLDFRMVEVGYGVLQETGTYSHSYPLLSVSSGFVFHIPPRQ